MKPINIKSWFNPQPLNTNALRLLTFLRLGITILLLLSLLAVDQKNWLSVDNQLPLVKIAFTYFLFSLLVLVSTYFQSFRLPLKLPLQISVDIIFIILLMHAAGGSHSGFGVVLILVIVIGSLLSDSRFALFYAAIATIGLLIEHGLRIILFHYSLTSLTQPVLLSIACFATAMLAHVLGKRMQRTEALVSQQQFDLDNLAQINALISRETQDGVIVIDEHLAIKHYNATAARLISLKADKLAHLKYLSDLPKLFALYQTWQQTPDKALMLNDHTYSLKVQFLPIQKTAENQPLGAVIFIQDWSQQKTQSQQAKLAALGTLTAKIAHEIRNPLSSISHANQLLQEDLVNNDQVRMLEIIQDNIARIDQIIKNVLELNRRDRTNPTVFSLSRFVQEFHFQFCEVENISPSQFGLTLPKQPFEIQFDHRHLTQILWNLCQNGWEHSKKSENSLHLTVQSDVINLVKLVITDDGEGITEEHQAQLFEPFFTTKTTGSGLGLYISRELAEANGALLIYEQRVQGSAFILEIKQTMT